MGVAAGVTAGVGVGITDNTKGTVDTMLTPFVEGQEQSRFAISDWPWPGGSSEMGPCGAQFLPFSLPLLFFLSSLFFSSRFFFYQRRRFIGPEPH